MELGVLLLFRCELELEGVVLCSKLLVSKLNSFILAFQLLLFSTKLLQLFQALIKFRLQLTALVLLFLFYFFETKLALLLICMNILQLLYLCF